MFNFSQKTSLKDYTLIIPSTCVGNVSQLTSDLLIENLKMTKIADSWSPATPPLVGLSAFSHVTDKITTAAELYVSPTKKLAVFQIRTPLTAPLMGEFFQKLVEFAQSEQVKQVVILTSSYGYEKHSVQGSDFMYKSNKELGKVPELEMSYTPKILGGGYALQMFERFVEANVDTIILYKYVSEGDNIPDAVALLLKLNEIIQLIDKQEEEEGLKMPVSWKYLFGNRAPTEIY